MDSKNFDPGREYFEQLALGLDLDPEGQDRAGFVSPEEAKRRSYSAKIALSLSPAPQGGAEAAWMDQYSTLLEAGWPWRVACYIAWASSPRIGRWPETQDELAKQVLGLTSDRVIATWRKKNRAIDEVITILQAAPLMAHRADVFTALAKSASDPDHRSNPDRKLFLELTNDYIPRSKVDLRRDDVEDLSQLSEEELERLARLATSPRPSPNTLSGAGGEGAEEGEGAE